MTLITGAVWLHLLATVLLVGYYTVLAVIVLPTLSRHASERGAEIVSALERRAMPLLVGSLVAFLVTGVYLMTIDDRYAGAGNVNGPWATLLLAKHIVIIGMLGLASYVDGLIVRSVVAEGGSGTLEARVVWGARGMAVLGAVVLLLTAAAQAPS